MPDWLPATIAALLSAAALGSYVSRMHAHIVEHIDRQVHHLRRVTIMSVQDAVNAITAQLGRARQELLAKLADAQAQIDAAGVAEQVDLSALTEAAQALDDIVPDAAEVPYEVPAEVTDAELPGEVTGDPVTDDDTAAV